MGSGGSIPKSPVPSTLRMSQQVLRKKPKDFESELLDRLLNSYAPSAPAPGVHACTVLLYCCKQAFQCARHSYAKHRWNAVEGMVDMTL